MPYTKFLAGDKQRYKLKRKLPMWLIELLKQKEEERKQRERRIAEIERLLAGKPAEKAPCGIGEFAQRNYLAALSPQATVTIKRSRRERRALRYA
jgi:hypothetical protein